jgi:pimeloyl-ACP methyl ester carboxylesterase
MFSLDFYARRLIRHTPLPGQLRLALAGPARRLVRLGRIGGARRIPADGACIDTWIVPPSPAARPRGAVLLIHGLWDSKARMLPLARKLAKAGFCAVLPDLRCHGRSTGTFVTYGFREKHDLAAVMQSLAADGVVSGPTCVVGFSLGGCVAAQFAAMWPYRAADVSSACAADVSSACAVGVPPASSLFPGVSSSVTHQQQRQDADKMSATHEAKMASPHAGGTPASHAEMLPKCRGLVLLAPVASARMIMRRMLKFMAPFKSDDACRPIIDRAGELADFDVDAASAIDAARRMTCPTVVVHGLLDHTVPPEHGKAIFDALASPKQFVPVRWAGHNSLLCGRSDWIVQRLLAFSDADGEGKAGGQIGD